MKRFQSPRDIRVGVVGYGGAFSMGRFHLDQAREAGMTPMAVAEVDPERMQAAAKELPGIETYPSLAEMLRKSDVNLVVIITPHNTHAELAVQALEAGRHVVCEKPFAITTAECDRMIRAAQRAGSMISTFHNRHWDGAVLEAVKQVRAGRIGKVFRVEAHMGHWGKPGDWWRSSKAISGGILYDWGAHLVEYSLQVIDSEIVEVTGFARTGFWAPKTPWKDDTNEDEGFAVVRFRSGAWLTVGLSSVDSNPKRGCVEITGEEGSFVMVDNSQYEMFTHRGKETVVARGARESEGWRYYRNVADHLVKGEKLVITGEWARRPIHILDLAGRSAAAGRSLRAKYT